MRKTVTRKPAAVAARTVSRRASALGVPGSIDFCRASSKTAIDIARVTLDLARGFGEQRQVTSQQGALREDRERRAVLGERPHDVGHEPVPPLGALVGVGVRAEHDGFRAPTTRDGVRCAARSATLIFTTICESKSAP